MIFFKYLKTHFFVMQIFRSHFGSFLSPYLDVLLQKIYWKDKCCSWKIFTDYSKWLWVSLYPLLLEDAHQVTFHQRCINSLMIQVYKYLNGHSPDIMNDAFKLREYTYNLQNFHIFQTENPRPLKYGLDALPYCASQLWQ